MRRFSDEAMGCLLSSDWPGNVRELKNLLESIFVEGASQDISLPELAPEIHRRCMELQSVSGNERERLLWALSTI